MSATDPPAADPTRCSAPGGPGVVAREGWRHEPHPELYAPILASFAPTPAERRVALLLLALLRLPGVTRLLRAWHARRTG